jgi:hypothetical protein
LFSLCSVTSLGIPFMSEGFHVNTSRFALRKSTSALSYLGSSAYPDMERAAIVGDGRILYILGGL